MCLRNAMTGGGGDERIAGLHMTSNLAWIAAHVPQFPEMVVLVGLLRQVGAAEPWPCRDTLQRIKSFLVLFCKKEHRLLAGRRS